MSEPTNGPDSSSDGAANRPAWPSFLGPSEVLGSGEPAVPRAVPDAELPLAADSLPTAPALEQTPPLRRRGRLLIGAGVSAAVLLLGASSVVAYGMLAAKGADPESVIPASAIGFVKVDLDPPAGEKVALLKLLRSVPDISKGIGPDGDLAAAVADELAGTSGGKVSADQLRSWLGKRFAVTFMADGDKTPFTVLIAASTNQDATKTTLKALDSPTFVAFDDGFAVITDTQAHLAEYQKALAAGSMQNSSTFTQDRTALGGDQIALAWVDLTKASDAVTSYEKSVTDSLGAIGDPGDLGGLGGLGGLDGSGSPSGSVTIDPSTGKVIVGSASNAAFTTNAAATTPFNPFPATGHAIVGLHVSDSGLELSALYDGPQTTPLLNNNGSVAALPASTSGALSVTGIGTRLAKQLAALPAGYRTMVDDELTKAGVSIEGITSLTSADVAVASQGDLTAPSPAWAILAQTSDPARGLGTADTLLGLVGDPSIVSSQGNAGSGQAVYIGSDQSWVTQIQGTESGSGKTLGSEPLFQEAIAYPEGTLVGYLNVSSAFPGEDSPVAAVGVSSTESNGYQRLSVRVILH